MAPQPRRRRPSTPVAAAFAAIGALFLLSSSFSSPADAFVAPRPTARVASSQLGAVPDVVVVSPPGGIGEMSAVESARLGASVRWFVVSAPSSGGGGGGGVGLSSATLASVAAAGGSLELAGSAADDLLASGDGDDGGDSGALSAAKEWCAGASCVVATYDGAAEERRRADRSKTAEQREQGPDGEDYIRKGVRLAAREAAGGGRARTVALLGAGEEVDAAVGGAGDEGKGGGLLGALFGGTEARVPGTLAEALGGKAGETVRYGELFGAPESSAESSPFAGGPRRDPFVRDMYVMRSVRVDRATAVASSSGEGTYRTNREAVASAASRLALDKIAAAKGMGTDVSISSFAGADAPSDEEWEAEFARVAEASASSDSGAAALFRADFASVPSKKRLAEWIATKWAPAVLRSYDIAGTRVGARPVYAAVSAMGEEEEPASVEIVWQELVDFVSVTSGRMIVEIGDDGLTAYRGAGDAKGGFGRVSVTPLPGEEVLVRRLGDAASQAVEKGLATKPQLTTKKRKAPEPAVAVAAPAKASEKAASVVAASPTSGSGPRGAGARRSAERSRGNRRRATGTPQPSSSGKVGDEKDG